MNLKFQDPVYPAETHLAHVYDPVRRIFEYG